MTRWPRPWRSQEDRDEARWWTGRMEAQARGMRQAASRDLPASGWQPGPVPPARQARRQERELIARRDPADGSARAEVLARAMEQALRHERGSGQQARRQPTPGRGSR
jgi:hypothetical protein